AGELVEDVTENEYVQGAKRKVSETGEEIADSARATADSARAKAGEIKDKITNTDYKEMAKEKLDEAGKRLKRAAGWAQEEAGELLEDAQSAKRKVSETGEGLTGAARAKAGEIKDKITKTDYKQMAYDTISGGGEYLEMYADEYANAAKEKMSDAGSAVKDAAQNTMDKVSWRDRREESSNGDYKEMAQEKLDNIGRTFKSAAGGAQEEAGELLEKMNDNEYVEAAKRKTRETAQEIADAAQDARYKAGEIREGFTSGDYKEKAEEQLDHVGRTFKSAAGGAEEEAKEFIGKVIYGGERPSETPDDAVKDTVRKVTVTIGAPHKSKLS
ncbi:hypothetical protein COOONC_16939, partial [Cooperia oncophora]